MKVQVKEAKSGLYGRCGRRLTPSRSISSSGGGGAGVLGIWEKGYLFSGSWGALLIILGELGSKHILLGI